MNFWLFNEYLLKLLKILLPITYILLFILLVLNPDKDLIFALLTLNFVFISIMFFRFESFLRDYYILETGEEIR
jgi:hypothetical protein